MTLRTTNQHGDSSFPHGAVRDTTKENTTGKKKIGELERLALQFAKRSFWGDEFVKVPSNNANKPGRRRVRVTVSERNTILISWVKRHGFGKPGEVEVSSEWGFAILSGKKTPGLKSERAKRFAAKKCFSIITPQKEIDLVTLCLLCCK